MSDGRKNNRGTIGNKGGRPPKAKELKLVDQGIKAIEKEYGSQQKFWDDIAKKSKASSQHLKLLCEYIYGKPKETKDIKIEGKAYPDWMKEVGE